MRRLKNSTIFLRSNQGMTLIEVLLVMALLLIVLVPALNSLTATNKIWTHNDAITPRITEANTAMMYISREIRGANQPANTVEAVAVEDDQKRLVIYRYQENTSEWEKIVYQLIDNKLNKIILSNADLAALISTAIPATNDADWQTMVEGVSNTSVFSRADGSRTVDVNLQIADTGQNNKRFSPFTVASTYMIRSLEVGAIQGEPADDETTPPVIDVVELVLNPSSATLFTNNSNRREETVYATISPANATNKSLTWSSSDPDWIQVIYDTNDSLHATIKLLKRNNPVDGWEEPPTVTITATPNGGGSSATCTVTIKNHGIGPEW